MSETYYVNCIDKKENVFVVAKLKHGFPYVEVKVKDCKTATATTTATKGGKRKTQKRKYNK